MLGTSVLIDKKPQKPPVKLSLVALMDIFTILVFFLLMNTGDSQTLENVKFVKLPDSSSETSPHNELVVHIGLEELWLEDQKLTDTATIPPDSKEPIDALSEALATISEKRGELTEHEKSNGMSITIMADREVPYAVLKSVMATCSGENFREISLAVNRVAAQVLPDVDQSEPAALKATDSEGE